MAAKAYWLASYPKSGNTWVRFFLNAYFLKITDINKMMLTEGDNAQGYIQQCLGTRLEETPREPIQHARLVALYNRMAANKIQPSIFKTHNANIEVDGVPLIPPNYTEGVLYIVRNPLAIIPSWARHMNVSCERAIAVMADPEFSIGVPASNGQSPLQHYLTSWSMHVESYLAETRYKVTVVRYEDMVSQTMAAFEGIARFMDLEGNASELEWAVAESHLDKLKAQEEKSGFNESAGTARRDGTRFFGASDDWQEVLTEVQKQKVLLDHGATMSKLGYGG